MMTDAELLARLCGQRDLTIAVAESLTAGLLASTVGEGPDAQEWFCGGIVAYRTDAKERLLGLSPGMDPCSAECAQQLALGTRNLLGSDLVVATTGVGGPDPEDGHPPGSVYLGWSTAAGVGARFLELRGTPREILDQTVDAAVALLVELAGERPIRART